MLEKQNAEIFTIITLQIGHRSIVPHKIQILTIVCRFKCFNRQIDETMYALVLHKGWNSIRSPRNGYAKQETKKIV